MLRSLLIFLGLAAVAFGSTAPSTDMPALTAKEVTQGYRDSYVLAKPRASHLATVDAAEAAEGLGLQRKFSRFGGLRLLKLRAGDSPATAVHRLAATGRYQFVEPDRVLHALDVMPDDPDFDQQWGLSNTGTNGPGSGIAGADIHATAAWSTRTSASSVVVAVIDTGARLTHQDLAANLWINPQENLDGSSGGYPGDEYGINAVSDTGNPSDDNGHGTHVAGILGAVGNNGAATSGVAWQVKIMPLKFLASSGNGSTSDEIKCIDFAIAHGANLINASFGSSAYSQSEYTAIQTAGNNGIVFVAAAGNNPEDNDLTLNYPAGYLLDNVMAVGCSDNRDDLAYFSSYGSGIVDLFAPGYLILSLYDTSDTATATLSGTSMSTPMVTGSLALLKAQFPSDTYRQLINRVLGTVDTKANFLHRAQSGGRLNLAAALLSTTNAPFNDNFSSRGRLSGATVVVRSNNAGAGLEAGEPVIAGTPGGHSLWWEWTAPANGTVEVATSVPANSLTNQSVLPSGYPTLVGVYTGTAVGSLSPVASNATPGAGASNVSFTAQAGTTYEITVDGQNGATGLTILQVNYANDTFAEAMTLSGTSVGITGSTVTATRQSGEPIIQGNAGGHSLWYNWTAPANRQYQVSVVSPDFDPLLGIYTGNSVSGLTLVTSAKAGTITGASTPASTVSVSFSAAAGTTYRIAVDGASTDDSTSGLNAGQFTLNVDDSAWQAAASDSVTCAPAVGGDGTVYVGAADDYLYALNPNGSVKWKYKTGGSLDSSSACVSGDGTAVYASSADGYIYSLATSNGALQWHYRVSASPPASGPALAADGTLYVKDSGNTLYALTPSGGVKWTAGVSGISYAAPSIAADGTVYLGSDNGQSGGTFYAFDPATGALKWTFNPGAAIYTSAAIDSAGNVYFGTLSGQCFALNALGKQIWSYQTGNSITSSPALGAGGVVYFASYDHNLYALSTANGAVQWTCPLGGEVRASSPAVDANGVIYIGCYDNNVYAINPNGTLNRTFATGDLVRSSPVIANNTLYFGSDDHQIYAFAIGAGPASTPWPMYLNNLARTGLAPAAAPTILTQPQSQTATSGSSVTLSVAAYGSPAAGSTTLSYVWSKGGTPIAGATSSSYTIASAQVADSGSYSVTVGNGIGSVPSAAATLSVISPASLSFTLQPSPQSATVASGRTAVFNALAAGTSAATYQWTLNGSTTIPGASRTTDAILMITGATGADDGTYVCLATNSAGTLDSNAATLSVASGTTAGYLTNLAARADVLTGGDILIAGLGLSGSGSEPLLVRGVGPGLTHASPGFTGYIPTTQLTLVDNQGNAIVSDAGWGNAFSNGTSTVSVNPVAATTALFNSVGAFGLTAGSTDSAMEITAPSANYTAELTGQGSDTGVGLVEIYDAGAGTAAHLINLSARADVGAGGNILIGGFTIGPSTSDTVLIRAIGPTLGTAYPSLAGSVLAQPVLTIYSGSTAIYSNTAWGGDTGLASVESAVGAYPLPAANALDSMLLLTLPPGGYTAEVTGVGITTGIATVEIYEVP